MATNLEPVKLGSPEQYIESLPTTRLQRLIDEGAVYVPQALNPAQFATLHALLDRILTHAVNPAYLAARLDAALANAADDGLCFNTPRLRAVDYQLGLDELDSIARTRTGYAFAELPAEIRDAILGLIASGDLTTRKLDLALWLEDLHSNAAAL